MLFRFYTLTNADTWYQINLPPGASRFRMQPRTSTVAIKVRFDLGDETAPAAAPSVASAAQYHTMQNVPGQLIECELTSGSEAPRPVYVSSPTAGTVIEILVGV